MLVNEVVSPMSAIFSLRAAKEKVPMPQPLVSQHSVLIHADGLVVFWVRGPFQMSAM